MKYSSLWVPDTEPGAGSFLTAACSNGYVSGQCIGNGRYEYTDYPAQVGEFMNTWGKRRAEVWLILMLGVLFIYLLEHCPHYCGESGIELCGPFSVFNAGSNI